jgi:glutathione S-transferase
VILVGLYDSPFVRRVAVTLHHYGMAFERRAISVYGDFDAVLAANPLGKAPALVLDDGAVLADSTYILDHLDRKAGPGRSLTPLEGRARTEVHGLVAVALGLAEKNVEYRTEAFRRPEEKRVPERLERVATQIAHALAWLEARAAGPWLAGPAMTQADVTLACAVTHMARRNPQFFSEAQFPRLAAHRRRCEALPPFAAAPFVEG